MFIFATLPSPPPPNLYISSFGFPSCISYCIKRFLHFPILQSSYKQLFSCALFLSLLFKICCSKNFPPIFVSLQISIVHVPHSLLLYIAGTFLFSYTSPYPFQFENFQFKRYYPISLVNIKIMYIQSHPCFIFQYKTRDLLSLIFSIIDCLCITLT